MTGLNDREEPGTSVKPPWRGLGERVKHPLSVHDAQPHIVAAVEQLGGYAEGLSARISEAAPHMKLELRLRALQAAREHVRELCTPPERGGRGSLGMTAKDIISEELRIARYLLGRGEDL